jgi:peptide chain release factor 1
LTVAETSKKFDSVALYRIRKLLSDLSNKTGRGTELVSLYLPPKKAVHEAIAALREESGTASNIKSDTTRNHVQDALTKTMARLRLYKQTPENGIVIFCGAIPGPGGPGNETIELYEVLPQKPVTVYLYRCVSPDTRILLDNGTHEAIRDLESHWREIRVFSYKSSTKTIASAAIKHHLKTGVDGRKAYRIKVESGRSVIATEDHPFYTPAGWKSGGDLREGDLVCLNPVDDLLLDDSRKSESTWEGIQIVDEESLRGIDSPPPNIGLTIRRLKERHLLPLDSANPKLYLLARLLGHLLSDGSLTRNREIRNGKPYVHFTIDLCVGSKEDIQEISSDLAQLGVKLPPSFESTHYMRFDDRSYVTKTVHAKLRDTALITLLRALGAPVGSKVKNGTSLPKWLNTARRSVQREFLAAYMGGNGEAPRILGSNPASAVKLTFHRSDLQIDEALIFAHGLKSMFAKFGVKVNTISRIPSDYCRKDALKTSEIELRFQLSESNVLKLCHAVGYRYCRKKADKASLVGEYLRIKSNIRAESQAKMAMLKEMVSVGTTVGSASQLLNLSQVTARQWASGKTKSPLVRVAQLAPFSSWLTDATNGLAQPLVWESITSKEDYAIQEVMDLTIESEEHSFFANGFLVHNCDDHFHLDPLREMLREQNVIGILAMDATEAGLGIVSGDLWDVIDTMSSGVSGKTKKGGQSARRYERLREMELSEYFTRVAEHAKAAFLEQYQIKGLIVSGPGPTKDEFVKDKYLDYRLQNVIVGTLDSGYTGREGVRETIEKAGKLLENVRVVEERKLAQRFLREVNTDGGLAIYGINDILAALKKAAVDTIIVNDDIDMVYERAICKKCGNITEKFIRRSEMVSEKQSMLVCPRCGSNEIEFYERDIVDYLADAAVESGANVEVISSKTEDGAMMKNFGGISALLRYRA